MKNNKLFNKAVDELQQSGSKASDSLGDVANACSELNKIAEKMFDNAIEQSNARIAKEMIEAIEKSEEWIWVTGYKGTDKDMRCRGYQFMFNYRHDMAAGAEISICSSGFHFCPKLKDVFNYYSIGKGNRFFEVRALVRKKDYEDIGKTKYVYPGIYPWSTITSRIDKLTSKSIEFVRELTLDEIFAGTDAAGWSDENKKLALEVGIEEARLANNVADLVSLGYSEQLSNYIVQGLKKYSLAKFLCTLPENPSMDTKMIILFGTTAGCNESTLSAYDLYAKGVLVNKN